jgi:digeranylgeranylglycerophospholipid reductase
MNSVSDVIVVGGGPCGTFTALKLAKLGAHVTVFEEHKAIGVPSHCPGHMSIKGLKHLGLYPLPPGIVENTFRGATFHSPIDKTFSVRFPSPVTCTVNRVSFDKHIAGLAEASGAHFCMNLHVKSLITEDGFVKGVNAEENGQVKEHFAKIVIDAEGISSKLLRQAGLRTLDRHWLMNGVAAEVESVKNISQDMVEVYLGRDCAPGFFAWLIPTRNGKAKVGLGARIGNPKELLERFMLKHPSASKKLQAARVLHMAFHPITLGGPIPKTYSNGFLVVGDAASHVKPTTGGGIVLGLTCASVAAEVAFKALRRSDCSAAFLASYQRSCEEAVSFDIKVMFRLRRMLDSMSDRRFDEAIRFCAKLGLDRTLQNIGDIDFQGRSLLHAVRDPRILTALGYLFYIYLFANP